MDAVVVGDADAGTGEIDRLHFFAAGAGIAANPPM